MSQTIKLSILAMLCAGLIACGGQQARDDSTDTSDMGGDTSGQTDTSGIDDGSTMQIDPFEDPENLLSKRVIYFDFDKADVQPQFRDIIRAHAAYLRDNPSARVTVEGHADERGSREYNLGLGERRGNAVVRLLEAQGARSSQLSVVSYGEERPVATCSEDRCWSQNRRAEIVYTAR
jgi:peptidoglycan-associated lipoprotein